MTGRALGCVDEDIGEVEGVGEGSEVGTGDGSGGSGLGVGLGSVVSIESNVTTTLWVLWW